MQMLTQRDQVFIGLWCKYPDGPENMHRPPPIVHSQTLHKLISDSIILANVWYQTGKRYVAKLTGAVCQRHDQYPTVVGIDEHVTIHCPETKYEQKHPSRLHNTHRDKMAWMPLQVWGAPSV